MTHLVFPVMFVAKKLLVSTKRSALRTVSGSLVISTMIALARGSAVDGEGVQTEAVQTINVS